MPDSLWGLQQGDVISAIDNHPVKHVGELMEQLRAGEPAAVKLQLRRHGAMQVITIAASDYGRIVSPGSPDPASSSTSPDE